MCYNVLAVAFILRDESTRIELSVIYSSSSVISPGDINGQLTRRDKVTAVSHGGLSYWLHGRRD